MNEIQGKDHTIGTHEIKKIILNNGSDGSAIGYYSYLWENSFFVKFKVLF